MVTEKKASACFPLVPPAGSVRWQRPSLPWVLRGKFPSFDGTMTLCDSLGPSRRAALPSLGDTLRRACRFAPCGPGRPTAGLGFVGRSPHPERYAGRQSGPPRFPCSPLSLCPVLRPRQDRLHQADTVQRHGPRYVHGEGSHEFIQLSRLNRTALGLAVYASSDVLPRQTQNWLPAAGQALPDGDWCPAGLLRKVSDDRRPPFTSLPGARTFRVLGAQRALAHLSRGKHGGTAARAR
jgi:hypothetical protein